MDILRIIELQKKIVSKCKTTWENLINSGLSKMDYAIPGVTGLPEKIELLSIKLRENHDDFLNYIDFIENNYLSIAQCYKSKLLDLLNKY